MENSTFFLKKINTYIYKRIPNSSVVHVMKQGFFRIFFSSLKYTKNLIENSGDEIENFFKMLQKVFKDLRHCITVSIVIFSSVLKSKKIVLISDKWKMQFMDLGAWVWMKLSTPELQQPMSPVRL